MEDDDDDIQCLSGDEESFDADDFDPFDKSDLWITDDDDDEDEGTETISSEDSEKDDDDIICLD